MLNQHNEIIAVFESTDEKIGYLIKAAFAQNSFGELPVTEYIINGESYTEGMPTVLVTNDGWYVAVPGSDRYEIRYD